MKKFISVVKDGKRYDIELKKAGPSKRNDIEEGSLVYFQGMTGRVDRVDDVYAYVSWDDGAYFKVPKDDLEYNGETMKMTKLEKVRARVAILKKRTLAKGGEGSGRYPKGSGMALETASGEHIVGKWIYDKVAAKRGKEGFVDEKEAHNYIHQVARAEHPDANPAAIAHAKELYAKHGLMGKLMKGGPGSGRYPKGSGGSEIERSVELGLHDKSSVIAPSKGKNGYVVFYNGKRFETYADTSYAAHKKIAEENKIPEKKQHMMSVVLAEKDGKQVTHLPLF